jgi:putative acetyltransferase
MRCNRNISAGLTIRPYGSRDLNAILRIFFETVHTVNRRDYTEEQLDAWASETPDRERWESFLTANTTHVGEVAGSIVGFGDLTCDGYLHALYVHREFLGRGIGSCLLSALEAEAQDRGLPVLRTYASITARPFFERHGYRCLGEDALALRGVVLLRFRMDKRFL